MEVGIHLPSFFVGCAQGSLFVLILGTAVVYRALKWMNDNGMM
jgi:hypothetical protein